MGTCGSKSVSVVTNRPVLRPQANAALPASTTQDVASTSAPDQTAGMLAGPSEQPSRPGRQSRPRWAAPQAVLARQGNPTNTFSGGPEVGLKPEQLAALAPQAGHLDPKDRQVLLHQVKDLAPPERAFVLLGLHGAMSQLTGNECREITSLTLRTLDEQPSGELFASLALQIPTTKDIQLAERLLVYAEGSMHARGERVAALTVGWPVLNPALRERVVELAQSAPDETDRLKALQALCQCRLQAGPLNAVEKIAYGFQNEANLVSAFTMLLQQSKMQAGGLSGGDVLCRLVGADSTHLPAAVEAIAGFAAELDFERQIGLVRVCKLSSTNEAYSAELLCRAARALPWLLSDRAKEFIELANDVQAPQSRGRVLGALCAHADQLGGQALNMLVDHAVAFYKNCDLSEFAPPEELGQAMDSMQPEQSLNLATLIAERGHELPWNLVKNVMAGVQYLNSSARGKVLEAAAKLPDPKRAQALQVLGDNFEHLSRNQQQQLLALAQHPNQAPLPAAPRLTLTIAKEQARLVLRERAQDGMATGSKVASGHPRPDLKSDFKVYPPRLRAAARLHEGQAAYSQMPHPTPTAVPRHEASVATVAATTIAELRASLQPLTPKEAAFVDRFLRTPFYATHVSDGPVAWANDDGQPWATLYSRDELQAQGISFDESHTTQSDRKFLKNTDFVFFSLEAGHAPKKPSSRFGSTVYRFDMRDSRFTDAAWLSTTEALKITTPEVGDHIEGLGFADEKLISFRPTGPDGVFQGINMLGGLALRIVEDCRKLSSVGQSRILATPEGDAMDAVINGLYRPEIKVPRRFIGPLAGVFQVSHSVDGASSSSSGWPD